MHIDSEVHFWKYEKTNSHILIGNSKFLKQDYLPEQLTQSLQRNGMDGCIAVVTEDAEVETRFLSELALTHPEILGVVGWTDFSDPHATDKIQELQQYAPLKGFKSGTANGMEPSQAVMDLLHTCQYSLDLSLDSGTDMAGLDKWIKGYPGQQFILQHGGSPDTNHPPSSQWENQIRELAKNQNVSCKISGLLTAVSDPKSWKPADFYPFLEIIFDSFGTDRLLFASDWPFLLAAGSYVQWKSLLQKFSENFSLEDCDKLFGENAKRIYRL
jgi:L-fuconolactonase